jgi:choline dehydrogenase-like flavoprotein
MISLREEGQAMSIRTKREESMTANHYDAIVVGARCAGFSIAMLLARKGYNVLAVDRATFGVTSPSDFFSHENVSRIMAQRQELVTSPKGA